jgi:hypothetical protein
LTRILFYIHVRQGYTFSMAHDTWESPYYQPQFVSGGLRRLFHPLLLP